MDAATIVRVGLSLLLGMGAGATMNKKGMSVHPGEEPLVWEVQDFPNLQEVDAYKDLHPDASGPSGPIAPSKPVPSLIPQPKMAEVLPVGWQMPLTVQAMPRQIEEPKGNPCPLPEVWARLGWVDDQAIMTINGAHTMEANWGQSGALLDGKHDLRKPMGKTTPGDTGKIGIDPWVKPGMNTFNVKVNNKICCGASVYVDIWVGGEQKLKERWVKHYGKTGTSVYDQTFEVELPQCGMRS
jgi:hypothetical protein